MHSSNPSATEKSTKVHNFENPDELTRATTQTLCIGMQKAAYCRTFRRLSARRIRELLTKRALL